MTGNEPSQRLEAELIQAVHERRLRSVVDRLLTEPMSDIEKSRISEVKSALEAFDARQATSVERVAASLRAVGIEPRARRDTSLDGRQILQVTSEESALAVDTVLEAGFRYTHSLSPGAQTARQKVAKSASFSSTEDTIASLRIEWGDPSEPSRVGRMTQPGLPDLMLLALPSSLWWAYWLVKPVRVAIGLIGLGRRAEQIPFLGTPRSLVAKVIEIAEPAQEDVIVDLGCGDGRVLIEACSAFQCRGRGIELDQGLVREAEARVDRAGLKDRISIELGDLTSTDLTGSTIGFVFLPSHIIESLLSGILDRAPAGFRLVAHELNPIRVPRAPNVSRVVVSSAGVTVAHLWRV